MAGRRLDEEGGEFCRRAEARPPPRLGSLGPLEVFGRIEGSFSVRKVSRRVTARLVQNFGRRTHVKKSWGLAYKQSSNIVEILLNAVRKRRDHKNSVLHTAMQLITEYGSLFCDIP